MTRISTHGLRNAFLLTLAATPGLVSCASPLDGTATDGASTRSEDLGSSDPRKLPALSSKRLSALQAALPSARLHVAPGGLLQMDGPALITGGSAAEAAEQFRRVHAAAMGIDASDLVPARGRSGAATNANALGLMIDEATGQPRFWLYRYDQAVAGIPVYGAEVRTLIANDGHNSVVWASSSVRDLGQFVVRPTLQVRAPDLEKSLRAIPHLAGFAGQALVHPTSIRKVSEPQLMVFAGAAPSQEAPRMAIVYTAETLPFGTWKFVADADSGEVLQVDSHLMTFDSISGTVTGKVTQGDVSMDCAQTAAVAFPYAELSGPGETQYASASGAYNYPVNSTTNPAQVLSYVAGSYFHVTTDDANVPIDTLSKSVTWPATNVNFQHNAAGTNQSLTAQANAYVAANQIRDWVLKYLPAYPTISSEYDFPIHVNSVDTMHCPSAGAWYLNANDVIDRGGDVSINFCAAQDPSVVSPLSNTAFASVIHHEYGHHIVDMGFDHGNQHSLYQLEYGEGMGDTLASLIAGQHAFALGWTQGQCSTPRRDAANTCQYDANECSSCGFEAHACGQLLSGTVWDIRTALAITNPSTYADIINNLILNSILVHSVPNITPQLAVELLVLDDTDGNLANGTPHYTEICTGFAKHGMACPSKTTGNVAPVASAGSSQTITLPVAVTLSGTAMDDGLPNPPAKVSTTWSKVSGPGTVTFASSIAPNTTATFSASGSYVLRLTANDGALQSTSNVTITVNPSATPCTGLCTSPSVFTVNGSYQSGNLGTGAVCRETTSVIHGGNCSNFVSPRALKVNGTTEPCTGANWASLPATRNGGYCVQTTAGNQSYASFSNW